MRYLFFSLFAILPLVGYTQKKSPEGFSVIGVPKGGTNNLIPTPEGETLQFFTPEVNQDVIYSLDFVEYIDGDKKEDDISQLGSFALSPNNSKRRFQVVPDVSRIGHFILFGYLSSGAISFQHRYNETNTHFQYILFEETNYMKVDTEIPLLAVFDNDNDLKTALAALNKKDSKVLSLKDFKKIISAEFPVKRVSVLYYTLKTTNQ